MGQYYKKAKIGTCENMYYLRMDEASRLAEMGEKDDDGIKFERYLNDGITRFRFPWPTEDNESREQLASAPYDKTFEIPAGGVEVSHDTISVHNTHKGGGHGINITFPCPYSKEFRDMGVKTSIGGAGEQFLSVMFQAMRDTEGEKKLSEKTIFGCARCGQMQAFTNAEVEKIKQRAQEYFEPYNRLGKNPEYGGNQGLYDYAMNVLARIK